MNCTRHPQETLTGTCDRCGNFVCRLDSARQPSGQTVCLDCNAQHGEVDWLQAFKAELWGKRDGWAWLFGLGGLFNVLSAVGLMGLVTQAKGPVSVAVWIAPVICFIGAAVQIAYFMGVRWARAAVVALPLVGMLATGANPNPGAAAGVAGFQFFGFLIALAIYFDTRNKLFFKIDVPEDKLRKLWDRSRNNMIASTACVLSLLGLIVPGLAAISLICAIVGLRRVNPTAVPPIGKRGYAIAGIVFSVAGLLLWGGLLISGALHK
jgi:hypothetical protein